MITTAIMNLRPNSSWMLEGVDINWVSVLDENGEPTGQLETPNFKWFDEHQTKPSKEELDAEVARLEEEFANTEYQRLRQPEYPPLSELADALYWQSKGDESKMTAYLAAVEAVKQKYPKGV